MAKEQQKGKEQQKQSAGSRGSERLTEATLARTGTRGEITQVRAKILQGKNRGKSIRRNVRGPIKKRDILMLRETEIEARRVMQKIKGGYKKD